MKKLFGLSNEKTNKAIGTAIATQAASDASEALSDGLQEALDAIPTSLDAFVSNPGALFGGSGKKAKQFALGDFFNQPVWQHPVVVDLFLDAYQARASLDDDDRSLQIKEQTANATAAPAGSPNKDDTAVRFSNTQNDLGFFFFSFFLLLTRSSTGTLFYL
jgi:hypothetical protein